MLDHPSLQDATRLMGEIDQYELRPEVAQTWGYAEMMFREKYSALPEELFQTPAGGPDRPEDAGPPQSAGRHTVDGRD